MHPLTLLVSVGQRFHFPQETKERLEEGYTSVAPDAKYGDEVASVAAESSAPAVGTPPPLRAPHPR